MVFYLCSKLFSLFLPRMTQETTVVFLFGVCMNALFNLIPRNPLVHFLINPPRAIFLYLVISSFVNEPGRGGKRRRRRWEEKIIMKARCTGFLHYNYGRNKKFHVKTRTNKLFRGCLLV